MIYQKAFSKVDNSCLICFSQHDLITQTNNLNVSTLLPYKVSLTDIHS
jgi:hypothetical protein